MRQMQIIADEIRKLEGAVIMCGDFNLSPDSKSLAIVTKAGGTAPYGFAIDVALPAGLSFDATSGLISGTPTVTSSATTYTITITDGVGAVTSKTFSLTVNSAVVATQAIASNTLTAGSAAIAHFCRRSICSRGSG